MVIFRFSKMAADANLDFQNFKFSTVDGFKRVQLHRRAKFGRNRSNRSQNMASFFIFSRWQPSATLICCVRDWTTHKGGLYQCTKVGWNRCISFDNNQV